MKQKAVFNGTCIGCQFRTIEEQQFLRDVCGDLRVNEPCSMSIGLAREPDNPYDKNAVNVFLWNDEDKTYKVGYYPKDKTDEAREFLDFLREYTKTQHVTSFKSYIDNVKYTDDGMVHWFTFRLELELENND